MLHVKLLKNHEEIDLSISSTISVLDTDFIQLMVDSGTNQKLEVYVEDYLLPIIFIEDKNVFMSLNDKIFRESFGHSHIRVFNNDELIFEAIFNVCTNVHKFDQVKSMVSYLLENNERVLDICFARTKFKMSHNGSSEANYETVLSIAEKIIDIFLTKKNLLASTLRSHLIPISEELNEYNIDNVNPYDVIENISNLFPSNDLNSIKIKNKQYSLDDIKRENYLDSYNLIENQILVGGLISIKFTLDDMQFSIKNESLTFEKEYQNLKSFQNVYSLDNLYLQLTTSGMELRIQNILNSISIILFEMQKKLKVSFNGYIHPKITPFAKNSSFYLSLFKELHNWYNLGSPNLGINQTLTKIRSISKIYELFCLYKIIEKLIDFNWVVSKSTEHKFFKNFIPSHIELKKDNVTLNLYYEKSILPIDSNIQNNDLIYLKHHNKVEYQFYTPDFVIRKDDAEGRVSYYILDSKYSSTNTLSKYDVLNELFRKYHTNVAVYDSQRNVVSSDRILSINALHPFGEKRLSKWHDNGTLNIIPDVSSIKVSSNENDLDRFVDWVDLVL